MAERPVGVVVYMDREMLAAIDAAIEPRYRAGGRSAWIRAAVREALAKETAR